MERAEVTELYYIAPIANLQSITRVGILSNCAAQSMEHTSVAKAEVQALRARKSVPQGRRLHEYANLYICVRNPMLYKISLKGGHKEVCVVRVSPDVLDIPGTVITDGNAASNYIQFAASPGGLSIVDRELTFAKYWNDEDEYAKFIKTTAKCAEVLVPDRVSLPYIKGFIVSCEETQKRVGELVQGIPVTVQPDLFFL